MSYYSTNFPPIEYMSESREKATLIWDKLFSTSNENKTKEEQINMIESVVSELSQDSIKLGRTQILRHIQEEIDQLAK